MYNTYKQNLILNGSGKIINNSYQFQSRSIILCDWYTEGFSCIQAWKLNYIINKQIIWRRHWNCRDGT